jgi:O-antigen/teichoic acid export membrane protein
MHLINIIYSKFLDLVDFLRNFFGKGHWRSVNVKKNILASFIIRILSILISLILVPLTIKYINPVQYGIWITLSSIIGWLAYFDIGFGNGLRNRFAESVAKGENNLAKIYVSTTYAVMGGIILILILSILLINPLLNWSKILNAPGDLNPELSKLALFVIAFFLFQLVLQLLSTVLTANQEPAKASALNLFTSAVSLTVIFILTKKTTGNILYLGIAVSSSPILVLLLSSIWFYTHKYRAYSPSFNKVDLRYVRRLMGLGIKFFILQIATLVIYQTSNIIIAHLFGSENVTVYNIAFRYFNVIPMVMLIIMMPLWSAITDAWTRKEITWITNTMKKLNYAWLSLSVLVILMLMVSKPVYLLWIGPDIHVPFKVSAVLAITIIVNLGAYIYSIFLNGVGIIKIQLLLAIVGMIIYVPLAIFFGKLFGLPGVIMTTFMVNAVNLIFFTVQYKRIVNSRAKGIWSK